MQASENTIHVRVIANRILDQHEPGVPVSDVWILDLCDRSLALERDYQTLREQYISLLKTLTPHFRGAQLPNFVTERRLFG